MRFRGVRLALALGALACCLATVPLSAQGVAPFLPTAASIERPQPGIDVLHYAFDLHLGPQSATVDGRAVITLVRQRGVRELRLDAVGLNVSECQVDGVVVPTQRQDSAIVVPLGARGGDTVRVSVSWTVQPSDGLVIQRDSARWTAFGDNWPNRARLWLPVVDHPSDKARVMWTVHVPAGFRVIANGVSERVDTSAGGANVTWRFRQTQPIPTYLMVIGVGVLDEVALGQTACGAGLNGGCVPQSVLVTPDARSSMPGNFAQAGEIVRFFSTLLGPFPYDRLVHVQSRTRFGGMENAGAIFYAWNLFGSGKTFPPGLIAHETAHQWFGDAVTERAWAHAWLSEGFATYLAAMYAEQVSGDSALRREVAEMRRAVLSSAVSRARPVVDTAQPVLLKLLNTNSYQKGGHVLHMLRREIGDSAFVRAMRSYQAEFRHGNAMTIDFVRAAERASQRELGWFFDQWLRKPGWPVVEVRWRQQGRELSLSAVQAGASGGYRLQLPLEIELDNGELLQRVARVEAASSSMTLQPLPAGVVVRAVRADPRGDLLGEFTVRALSRQ